MAAGAIEEQVKALVELHRPELQQLVDQALEAELARLVDERIAARNGNGHVRPEPPPADSVTAKVCTACHRSLPVAAFETGRGKCRECRRSERNRERRSTPVEADRPAEPGIVTPA